MCLHNNIFFLRKLITTLYNARKIDVIEALHKDKMITTPLPCEMHSRSKKDKLVKYSGYLKERYLTQTTCSFDSLEWPPKMTDKTFNLAMIKGLIVNRGKIDDRFVRMTITGKVDDILHEKSPIDLKDILTRKGRVVLLEGAPGSGKTTLTLHIRQKWSKGELFQEYLAVIVVQLRDPAVQCAKTIADLLPCTDKSMAKKTAAEIAASQGEDILWILDGWDELPVTLQKRSLFKDLIFPPTKSPVSKSTVVVSSRPISATDLHRCISNRIEILGFRGKELRLYFEHCLKEEPPTVIEDLISKVSENPALESTCYLPLSAAIVAHVYQCSDYLLPNTQYEMFLIMILNFIFRHIQKQGRHDDLTSLESFEELPDDLTCHFKTICKLAYDGIMENRVAFHSKCLPRKFNSFGLLQAVESLGLVGKCTFYHFPHLTFQEFLAAYYIAKSLKPDEQVLKFTQLFTSPRHTTVFQFYAAMSKLEKPAFPKVVSSIASSQRQTSIVALLRCVYEVQDPSLCYLVAEKLQKSLVLFFTSLNVVDCLAIGYFLSHACKSGNFTLNLSSSYIGNKGCKYLLRDLSAATNNNGKLTLSLPGYQLDEEGLQSLAGFLQSAGSSVLHSLYLGYKEPGDVIYTDTSDEAVDLLPPLAASIIANNSLVELSLKRCQLEVTEINGPVLAEMLCLNKSLQILTLEANPKIGDLGVFYIAKGITNNTSLKSLNLCDCRITSRGAAVLAQSLAVNKILESLSIDKNLLLNEGLISLSKALNSNTSLKDLSLVNCGMTNKSLDILGISLVTNDSIKSLGIGEQPHCNYGVLIPSFQVKAHDDDMVTEQGLMAFVNHLSKRRTTLGHLKLTSNFIYPKVMEKLHTNQTQIENLDRYHIRFMRQTVPLLYAQRARSRLVQVQSVCTTTLCDNNYYDSLM